MANKFPLVANTSANRIEELAVNDNLDLSSTGIAINGSLGINGYVLMTDGSTVKWAPVGNVVASGTQQLTNKVLDCANNTIINIPNSSLVNNSIVINGTTVNLGGSISGLSTASASETFTNKTIDANNNTISNIPNSSLVNSAISINGQQVSLGSGIVISQLYADVVASGVQTLTNKTMYGNQNNFFDIPNSALVNSYLTINGVQRYLGDNFTVGDITATGSGVFANKTIDGTQNNLTNISTNSLTSKTITFDNVAYELGSAYNLGVTTTSGVQTLTNKTFDGAFNTFSNIPSTSISGGFINVNGTNISLGGSVFVGDVTTSGSQVLTNKIIDGTLNSLVNIPNGALSSFSITLDGQEIKLGENFNTNRKKAVGTLSTNLGSSPSFSSDSTNNSASAGGFFLGKTNTSITTWNFTMPYAESLPGGGGTANGWQATYQVLIESNPSYTYGSSFSGPGGASGTIKWKGGSSPTAVSGYTLFTFRIIKDTSNSYICIGEADVYN